MSLARRLLFGLLLPLLCIVATWRVGRRAVALQIAVDDPSPAGLRRAATWDGQNPDFPFMLARYYRDLPEIQDLDLSRRYARRATELSPDSWKAWWQRAQLEEVAGHLEAAEQALRHAQALDPRDPVINWRVANFYIRRDELETARPFLTAALEGDPALQRPAVAILAKLGVDLSTVDSIWPGDADSRWALLGGLIAERQRFDPARLHAFLMREWADLAAERRDIAMAQGSVFIRYLLDAGWADDARSAWVELARRNGLEDAAFASGENLIWNGRFEMPSADGPLGWQFSKGSGYAISLASHEGAFHSTGLRITFDGSQNLNFAGVRQTVVVRPGTTYDLAFQTRSDALTTDRGVFVEVVDTRSHRTLLTTEPVLGTTPWTRRMEPLTVPANTDLIEIRLRRQPSLQIDSRIQGIFEFDDVALISVQP